MRRLPRSPGRPDPSLRRWVLADPGVTA